MCTDTKKSSTEAREVSLEARFQANKLRNKSDRQVHGQESAR